MKQYGLFCLLVFLLSECNALDTTSNPLSNWNGDPRLCTVDPPSSTINDKPLPLFPSKAEFALERVEIRHILNATLRSELTLYQYLYDYDANKLIMIKNANGILDTEYFYYEILKKSTYYGGQFCVVSDIDQNLDTDGTSAIQLANNTWHIRPLNEFLLFSSNDPRRPIIRPKYLGQSIVRDIPVDQWESCIIDRTEFRTVRRIWSIAQKGFSMPIGIVGNFAVPVQASISASVVFPNNTQAAEFDEIFNVYSYRPGIIESSEQLIPPKGVFCDSGSDQNLITLQEAGIEWPSHFSVRVEASSSLFSQWQRFHLRYDRGFERGSRRIRYDYMPPGADDFESVIHDYQDNLTYIIDRRYGSCKINRGVELPNVSPIRDPITFFIKYERAIIFSSHEKIWEFNGFRSCRDNSIRCASLTTSIDNFPPFVDSDTGQPNGETWAATNFETGWSVRSPYSQSPTDVGKRFDYPVYLYLRMYRFNDPSNPSPFDIETQDIEYEFYEMSYDKNSYDFDTSICYRSLNLEYLHLSFTLELSRNNAIDGNHLDRRLLEREIHSNLADKMRIFYSRITDIDVIHERISDNVAVFFTLLGPTPNPESPSGVSDNEPTAEESKTLLQKSIDQGTFQFTMKFTDDSTADVQFRAVSGSLKSSKQLMSPHIIGKKSIKESYSKGAQAGAVVGGTIVGLLIGILIAAIVRIVRREPMPHLPNMANSFSNPLLNIAFYNKKPKNDAKSATSA